MIPMPFVSTGIRSKRAPLAVFCVYVLSIIIQSLTTEAFTNILYDYHHESSSRKDHVNYISYKHNQIVPARSPLLRLQAQEENVNQIGSTAAAVTSSTRQATELSTYVNKGAKRSETIRRYQERASKIASSFKPSKFKPLPLLKNRHLQTISGVFLRSDPNCAYITKESRILSSLLQTVANQKESQDLDCDFWDLRKRMDTPDGDFYHVDIKYAVHHRQKLSDDGDHKFWWRSNEGSKGTVMVLHGLESNSNSTLSTDMADAYVNAGFDVAFLNFRGCSGVPNDTIGGYHLGFTDDLQHLLNHITSQQNGSNVDGGNNPKDPKWPIYLSGFSLGANVVLKALGELGESAQTMYNIRGASVTGAPFDQERNIHFVDGPGFNRAIYATNFLRTMKVRAQDQLEKFCDGDVCTVDFDYEMGMKAKTIAEFENAFIAKVYGFTDNVDYYQQTSCIYFLDGIAVPTLVLNAADDPFFDPDFFPWEKGCDFRGGDGTLPIKLVQTENGGHLGYMFHQPDGGDVVGSVGMKSSWMPTELARFVRHIHDCE